MEPHHNRTLSVGAGKGPIPWRLDWQDSINVAKFAQRLQGGDLWQVELELRLAC